MSLLKESNKDKEITELNDKINALEDRNEFLGRKISTKELNELKNNINVLLNGLIDKNKALDDRNNILEGKINIIKEVNKLNVKIKALENRNNILEQKFETTKEINELNNKNRALENKSKILEENLEKIKNENSELKNKIETLEKELSNQKNIIMTVPDEKTITRLENKIEALENKLSNQRKIMMTVPDIKRAVVVKNDSAERMNPEGFVAPENGWIFFRATSNSDGNDVVVLYVNDKKVGTFNNYANTHVHTPFTWQLEKNDIFRATGGVWHYLLFYPCKK